MMMTNKYTDDDINLMGGGEYDDPCTVLSPLVSAFLRKMATHKREYRRGICCSLEEEGSLCLLGYSYGQLTPLFRTWEGFSGDTLYPVGGLDEYCMDVRAGTLWTGPSGDRRRELCIHMANEIDMILEGGDD
jgi:hypothetical protein